MLNLCQINKNPADRLLTTDYYDRQKMTNARDVIISMHLSHYTSICIYISCKSIRLTVSQNGIAIHRIIMFYFIIGMFGVYHSVIDLV